MAIQKSDKQPQQESVVGSAFQEAAERSNNTESFEQPNATGHQRGVMGINQMLRRGMSRNTTSESVIAIRDSIMGQMEKYYQDGVPEDVRLLIMDNNKGNVGPLSCVLMCMEERVGNENNIVVFTMLIEASAPKFNSRPINVGGQNVEVVITAGDVFGNEMWNKISNFVSVTYGGNVNVFDAGQMVIPSEMDSADEESIRRVTFNVISAAETVLENHSNRQSAVFNIGMIDTNTDQLTVRADYNPGQAETATGEPVRSDVAISLQANIAGQQQSRDFEQVLTLTNAEGYVDLAFAQPQPPMPGQMPTTQSYFPRYVITRLDTAVDAITMELQLLALAQTTILSRSMGWAGVFRPRHHVKGLDTRDIGAIGYEVNVSGDPALANKKIDTKSSDFGDQQLFELISMNVHDNLIYSMDIEEVGELSWINQAFIAAANGKQSAQELIIQAADNLTMGQFSQNFGNEPICQDDNVRIPLGYYIDENGTHRDIREIDYLAMLNMYGKDDPGLVVKWESLFTQTNIPQEIRTESMINILKGMMSNNVHIKGYARRVTFNPHFLEALASAIAAAGLVVRPSNIIQDFNGGVTRGLQDAARFGFNGQATNSLFNYNTGSPYGGYQGQPNFYGRYGRRF